MNYYEADPVEANLKGDRVVPREAHDDHASLEQDDGEVTVLNEGLSADCLGFKLKWIDVEQVVLVDEELGYKQDYDDWCYHRHAQREEQAKGEDGDGDAAFIAEVVEPLLEGRLMVVFDYFLEAGCNFVEVKSELEDEAD